MVIYMKKQVFKIYILIVLYISITFLAAERFGTNSFIVFCKCSTDCINLYDSRCACAGVISLTFSSLIKLRAFGTFGTPLLCSVEILYFGNLLSSVSFYLHYLHYLRYHHYHINQPHYLHYYHYYIFKSFYI